MEHLEYTAEILQQYNGQIIGWIHGHYHRYMFTKSCAGLVQGFVISGDPIPAEANGLVLGTRWTSMDDTHGVGPAFLIPLLMFLQVLNGGDPYSSVCPQMAILMW